MAETKVMNRKIIRDEIGSEFWEVPVISTGKFAFQDNTRWFISGTSALEFILEEVSLRRTILTAAVPSWCCSSMIEPFMKRGIVLSFYSVIVDDQGMVVSDYSSVPYCDVTLVITYFGYAQQKTIGKPSGILIRDMTHSLFCGSQKDAQYYFGSLRKWAGFLTGGYAWKKGEWDTIHAIPPLDPFYKTLRRTAMDEKVQYLSGESEDKAYLKLFERAEEYLDECGIMGGDPEDTDFARHLDVETVKTKRQRNASILCDAFKEIALFRSIGEDDCPLFFPILLEPDLRDSLRQYLINQRIYCPIHWGISPLHQLTRRQRFLYEHEMSIICDQRYGPEEMNRIVTLMKSYLRNHS